MRGADIADLARRWIGTPYVHRASLQGRGADCLGLLRGVWRQVYGDEPCDVPRYSPDWGFRKDGEVLWRALSLRMTGKPRDAESAGDVVLFRMCDRGEAKHLGIQARIGDRASFVHAYCGHGVLETSLSAPWRRRIVARFAFPDIQKG